MIRRYSKRDFYTVNSWLSQRKSPRWGPEFFPKRGWVVEKNKEKIAVAFLRRCEKWGMIDCLVSNPFASSDDRHLGINELMDFIIKQAKGMGLTMVFAHSMDNSTLERSETLGFKRLPHTLIALDLAERGK